MDKATRQAAVEGLRRMMVTFNAAGAIADALDQFASAEAGAATWMSKLKAAQDDLAIATQKLALIKAQHDEEVKLIAKDAIALRDKLNTEINSKTKQLADLATQIADKEKNLAELTAKANAMEAQRRKLLASLNS